MNVIVAPLGMLLLATLPALTAGIEQAMVPDSNGPPLQSGIWYPMMRPP
jgi:hypothetical protein